MKLYKLTDADARTHGLTQWGVGVTHSLASKDNPRLCTADVLHAYQDPDLALLMNRVHGNYQPFRLWEAEGEPCIVKPDKLGCFTLTTGAELPIPEWYGNQASRRRVQVRFAVLAARAVLQIFESKWPEDKRPRQAIEAAERYLSGQPACAAYAAYDAAAAAAAAYDAYAAYAAYAAANAAYAAAAAAAYDAYDAYAAYAAANAAANAANAAAALDLASLARQAVAEEIKS